MYRGVNLGGWLVLEKWITPSVFRGTLAKDECSLMQELGEAKIERLTAHRNSFITEAHIAWIADHGLNAIRLPVPHWAFGGFEPFVECIEKIDWLMNQASQHNLKVLIDLHTAPGSQNGYDHSGQAGAIRWHHKSENIDQTVEAIRKLAERYGSHPQLIGFILLNEVHSSVPADIVRSYYVAAQRAVAPLAPGKLLVVGDSFQPSNWQEFAGKHALALDSHYYQVFTDEEKRMSLITHVKKAKYEWSETINQVQQHTPQIVGEWSVALDTKAFRGLDMFERDKGYQAYANAQLGSFAQAAGWFYWTLKTETGGAWSMQESISRGWLPNTLDGMLEQ